MSDKKLHLVHVEGEIYVSGDRHSDVRECIQHAALVCTGSSIKYLDIQRIKEVEEPDGHEHTQGQVRPA